MTTSYDLEARRKKIETWAKVVGLGVAAFLFAPFAIATVTGLISLIVVGVIGLLVVNVGVPWFAVSLANWRLKALKAAAAANPIETLENQYADRQAALLKIRDNIKQSYAVLQSLYSQIQEHNQKYPNTPSQFTDKYSKLKQLIELRGKKYKEAQASLAAFGDLLDEKRSDWKIAQTMAEASKLANVGEDFQSKLLKDTALTTVQDGLNLAFSELETSLLDEQNTPTTVQVSSVPAVPQIAPSPPPNTLDLGFDASDIVEVEAKPIKPGNRRNS
jgi:hypothetical protein